MPKKIIFDLGNVLFPLDYEELEEWLATTVEVYDDNFKSRFDELYINYESGDFDTAQFFEILRSELHMKFEDETFRQKWVSIWKRDIEGVHQILHELKAKGHPLHVLSNTNDMHITEYLANREILQVFDHAYYSHELKVAKPNPEIYKKVQALIGVPAEELIFFDDKKDNVKAACDLGWNAFVFVDDAGVRKQLEAFGCL